MSLFDVTADAMLVVDDFDYIIQANPVARQMLGYSVNQIMGLAIEAVIPTRSRMQHSNNAYVAYTKRPEQRANANADSVIALTITGQELVINMDLSILTISLPLVNSKSGSLSHSHQKSFALLTLHTVDRRRRAEEALLISEDRFRLAKSAAGLGVFDFSITSKTMHCDERMCELWGLPNNQDMTYAQYLAGIHPEDRPSRETALNLASNPNNKGEYQTEYRLINSANHTVHWILSIGKIFFVDGVASRCIGVVQDITERKLLEKNLQRQRIEMESLALEQVAAQTASAIAHEINQPLAAISAYSEVALRNIAIGKGNISQLTTTLERCVTQSQRAGKSLHELLAFLQKGEIVTEAINLNTLVKQAVNSSKNEVTGEFKCALYLEPNLPPVLGNKMQVQKVVINLVRNAVEAMRGSDTSDLSISVKVNKMETLKMAQVTVQDSGPGLKHETKKRIFDPFFTTKSSGIGMGLAVSRALIEANGGQLWLDQEPSAHNNVGAKFHFTLPFAS